MSTLPEGTVLGKYLIIRHLGSGGMADVYEAEDSRLGRRVALKVLPPELARNPQFIQRFESEVRKAASLNHGGIVPVFDFGLENGTHYYSMRLLTHGSLRNRIDDGLGDQEALSILRDMADALGHAHSRQPPLVHRDVKPENILFDEQGRPLLTDFGIAKAMDGNRNLTATGVAIGSALYMSPEQARGKKDLDGRADLYSLGALFYEMLMKVPPYDGEDQISIIFKHVTEPIPQFPEPYTQYQDLLDAMMAKNPAQRVASARDLVALIDPLLPQRPTRGNAGTRTTGQTQGVGAGAISGSVELERIEREQAAARAAERAR
ncbi:serine/threonine-protein kinase, partial [Nevskia sp.]|uniref:serine/threonine-protein kinase n=1 Tax=Nevskia sp. TaxID=1929292 RepID=UPI003F726A5D